MGRLGTAWAVCAVLALLCVQAGAQSEPVVQAWGNFLVVTAPDEGNSPQDRVAREQLGKLQVSFNFREVPFGEAVDFLGTSSGLNFVIHKNAGVEGTTVTLALKNVSVRTAVEYVTKQAGLTWTVRDGVVLIGNKEDLVGPMRTGVYEVTDLLAAPPDFAGPTVQLWLGQNQNQQPRNPFWPVTQTDPGREGPTKEKTRAEQMQELVDIVGGMLKAGTWDTSEFP